MCSITTPSAANSWPWDQQPQSALPIPLPASNFPIPLPYGLDWLLGHPFVTIILATGVYVTVPRIWRFFLGRLLLPAIGIAAAWLALQHPAETLSIGTSAYTFVAGHPIAISVAVLGFLAVTLSPYLLVLGFGAAVFFGIPSIPGPIRAFVPQPILQAESSLAGFSRFLKGQANFDPAGLQSQAKAVTKNLPFGAILASPEVLDTHLH